MNQLCKVCAEPAAGFHFGAFTCEGCKSFFGRTYNNLSQIHECKNGGVCIINKQNRTSCKACRLRKCLFVGMSKSGSRYGRRSNWFKIHCLLQEQASFASQPTNFRTPATPTLQDGSLPFVAAQMKDPIIHTDQPTNLSSPSTLSSSPLVVTAHSPVSGMNIGNLSPQIAPTYTHNSLLGHDRPLPEGLFRMTSTAPHVSPAIVPYRDTFINLLQRAHSIDPMRQPSSPESEEESHRKHLSGYSRMQQISLLGWDRRLREASAKQEITVLEEDKCDDSPKSDNPLLPTEYRRTSYSVDSLRDSSRDSPVRTDSPNYDGLSKAELEDASPTSKEKSPEDTKHNSGESKIQKSIMTNEERLNFLKNVNNVSNSCRTGSDHVRTRPTDLRIPPREEVVYGQPNNNLFSFPPYPPIWPAMLPFNPFSKLYSPFCPPRLPPPIPLEAVKYPYSFLNIPQQRCHNPPPTKEDPNAKKRLLDAILQVQKERRSPAFRSSSASPENLNTSFPAAKSNSITSPSFNSSDQPIDLSVRRKRKMDKSEIIYKPMEPSDQINVSEMEDESKKSPGFVPAEEKYNQISAISEPHTSPEAPLKLIKLDSSQEPVTT